MKGFVQYQHSLMHLVLGKDPNGKFERYRSLGREADTFTSLEIATNIGMLNTNSMNMYGQLHFEHKNDVTIVVKLLYRTMSLRQVPLKFYNDLDVIFMFKI